jgi:hypothetical protein
MTNRRIIKIAATVSFAAAALFGATACTSDADRVNENLNTSAEQFEVQRTIVFYNGITDKYIAVVEGRCSIERDTEKMQAICKVGPSEFTRDEIGLSDNVTYFALQTKPSNANVYHKRIILKPENALPNFDVQVGQK